MDDVRALIKKGYGRYLVARALNVPESVARSMIKKVRSLDNKPLPTPTNVGVVTEDKQKEIEQLVSEGLGRASISKITGISTSSVYRYLAKLKEGKTSVTVKRALELDEMVEDRGMDVYDLSKKLKFSPKTIVRNLRKLNDTYTPAEDWIRAATKTGVSFSTLQRELQIKTKEKALEALKEAFPGSFIIETPVDGGDVFFTPVKDSKRDLNKFNVEVNARPFDISVVNHNYVVVKFHDDLDVDDITIVNLTDIRVGANKFRRQLFKDVVEMIRTTPGVFVVLGGDSLEVITKACVADPAEQSESINEQVTDLLELLSPITDRIIAQVYGNHCSGRTEKASQFDLARLIANMLKVPYSRERMIIDAHWGGTMKRISLTHNYGKAMSKMQIENAVDRIQASSDYKVDVFFSGHNHASFITDRQIESLVPGRGLVVSRFFIENGGSFLGRSDTYASREGYRPTPQDTVFYTFNKAGEDDAGKIVIDSD
jgi:predicted transcriptional regulator